MWSIALLVNTSMWQEFQNNWKLICFVFLQLNSDEQNKIDQYQDILLNKISKIEVDPNIKDAIETSKCDEDHISPISSTEDPYIFTEYEDDEQPPHFRLNKRSSDVKKKVHKLIKNDFSY